MKRIIAFLLVVVMMISACCYGQQQLKYPDIIGQPRTQPMVIAIDKEWSTLHQMLIFQAMTDWEKASGGKVKFIVIWDQPKPATYKNWSLTEKSGIFLWKMPRSSTQLPSVLEKDWKRYYGVTMYGPGESVDVIIFDDVDISKFYGVALHELGHLLGMKHNKEKSNLHPNVLMDCISPIDAEQLCMMYGCVPNPNCPAAD